MKQISPLNKAQHKLKSIVAQYETMFAQELEEFKKSISVKRKLMKNEFGEMKGTDLVERQVLEYPETLDAMIYAGLEEEERRYFEKKEGCRWFAKTFPQYRLIQKI